MTALTQVSKNLRKFRLSRGLSLSKLSGIASVSVAQLSKLENGKVSPSLAVLRRLADALEVSLAALVAEKVPPQLNPVFRGEGYTFRRDTPGQKQIEEVFLHISQEARMQPEIMTFPPGSESGHALSHDGEEFFYVLEGWVRFFYGNQEPVDLKEGDFIYFDNTVPHRYENPDAHHPMKLLVCCSPPVF